MVKCPNCGAEEAIAVKCWTITSVKHRIKGDIPEFRVGIFICPTCGSKFRAKVDPKAKPVETNVKILAVKISDIREGLQKTLRSLREKITRLETERLSLLVEIEKLKKVAESRANALETEVKELREELKSLRELLGDNEEVG